MDCMDCSFYIKDTTNTKVDTYRNTLSLTDALPIIKQVLRHRRRAVPRRRHLAVAVPEQVIDRDAERRYQRRRQTRIPECAVGAEAVNQHDIRTTAELLGRQLHGCERIQFAVVYGTRKSAIWPIDRSST